jgi:hypothetical protein
MEGKWVKRKRQWAASLIHNRNKSVVCEREVPLSLIYNKEKGKGAG